MSLKYFQIVHLVSKLLLNYFLTMVTEVKSLYMYFSLIKLIPIFYGMYIMYSQWHFIKIEFIYLLLLF
jgi:hypothetical protein